MDQAYRRWRSRHHTYATLPPELQPSFTLDASVPEMVASTSTTTDHIVPVVLESVGIPNEHHSDLPSTTLINGRRSAKRIELATIFKRDYDDPFGTLSYKRVAKAITAKVSNSSYRADQSLVSAIYFQMYRTGI